MNTTEQAAPVAWPGASHIDPTSAYWLITDKCDLIAGVTGTDPFGGVWHIKLGVIRADGGDVIFATDPHRGWAMMCVVDNGPETLFRTIGMRGLEPLPLEGW